LAATVVIIVIIIGALTYRISGRPVALALFSAKRSLSAINLQSSGIVWCGMRADGFSRVESFIPGHLSDKSCAVECGNGRNLLPLD
jgi:hypothetical protein